VKPLAVVVPATPPLLLRHFWHSPFRALAQLLDRRQTTAECGHATRRRGILQVDEGYLLVHCPAPQPLFCLDCLTQHTIPCAWCGCSILPGDPVTLYSPTNPAFMPKSRGVVRFSDNPVTYVGCLRPDCAETGADRAGFWCPPEGVRRVPSVIETLLANPGKGVLLENVADPRSQPVLFDLPSSRSTGADG
jgi:hypothetical protein